MTNDQPDLTNQQNQNVIAGTATALSDVTTKADEATNAIVDFSNIGVQAGLNIKDLGDKVIALKDALGSIGNLSTKQAVAFSSLGTTLVGVRESFKEFERTAPTLNTFTGQITSAIEVLTAKNAPVGAFVDSFESMGIKIPGNIAKTKEAVSAFALAMAKGADNALRLESGLFQMSAATGQLDELTKSAGENFENLNDIASAHSAMLTSVGQAMQVPADVVEDYYMKLGQVPGALQSIVKSARESSTNVGMLAATMQYAIGSGRNYSDVIEDLKIAYKNMGMEGENALQFTSRIGEISNKFGIELFVVQRALQGATEDLRRFGGEGMSSGKIIQGAARLMNEYVGALKSTKISGASAISIVQDMTNKIANLDVAQRAFLSQQSGGAGGLRGAFQIEQMIRSGNIDEVMHIVQSTMQRQFGKIVSVEEASKSEEAASRAVMQRQMLMQGPLGSFAKTEQDAARILEAFQARSTGKISEQELSDTILQETMDKGLKFQELSATHLGVLRSMAESTRGVSNIIDLGLLQQFSAARVGTTEFAEGVVVPSEERMREYIRNSMSTGSARSGTRTLDIDVGYSGMAHKAGEHPTGRYAAESLNDWVSFVGGIGSAINAPIERAAVMFGSTSNKDYERDLESLRHKLDVIRAEANRTSDAADRQILEERAGRLQTLIDDMQVYRTGNSNNNQLISYMPNTSTRDVLDGHVSTALERSIPTPGAIVANAVATVSNVSDGVSNKENGTSAPGNVSNGSVRPTNEQIDINIHVDTTCASCGARIRASEQTTARLPTAR